jgi:hypothetical protein
MERTVELEVSSAYQLWDRIDTLESALPGVFLLDRLRERGKGVALKVTCCWATTVANYVSQEIVPVADIRELLLRYWGEPS